MAVKERALGSYEEDPNRQREGQQTCVLKNKNQEISIDKFFAQLQVIKRTNERTFSSTINKSGAAYFC